LTSIVIIIVQ